ncbi:MAG TPA: hypothetical protein VHT91_18360 [Kofleriaceae bacterium]|nr:hypothetical protein [Kofleriaceae bacterium]
MKPKHTKSRSREKLSVVLERLEKSFGKKEAAITTCSSTGHCVSPN